MTVTLDDRKTGRGSRTSFVGQAFGTALRGFRGVFYPMLAGIVATLFRLAMIFVLAYIVMARLLDFSNAPGPETFWLWSVFVGFPAAGWWFFSASCKVAWWRHFGDAVSGPRPGCWIHDLPAMMGMDLAFGCLKTLCLIPACVACYRILVDEAAPGIVLLAASLWCLCIVSVIHPAVVAQRLTFGPGVMHAFGTAVTKIARYPLKAFAVHLVPHMARFVLWGFALFEVAFGETLGALFLVAVSGLLPLIFPAFWLEFAYRMRVSDEGRYLTF